MEYKLYIKLTDETHIEYVSQLITVTVNDFFRRYCFVDKNGFVFPVYRFIRRASNKFYELCMGLLSTCI